MLKYYVSFQWVQQDGIGVVNNRILAMVFELTTPIKNFEDIQLLTLLVKDYIKQLTPFRIVDVMVLSWQLLED